MYTLKPTLWKRRRTIIFSRYWRKITFACKFRFFERLKSVRNDLKLSSHSPMDRMKKKSESLIKYYIKVTCAIKWALNISYHVKQYLTRVLSAFLATPVSVPITDSEVTYLSGHLSSGIQLGPGAGFFQGHAQFSKCPSRGNCEMT